MLVFYTKQPLLDINKDGFGLNRDRFPDRDWSELRCTTLERAKEVKETPELRQILLEDLAYTYGTDSKKFAEKLKEFNFKIE